MAQRLKNDEIDEVTQAALDSLPEQRRREIDACVADLAGTIGNRRGGKGFGVKRARELMFALGVFLNSRET